MFTSVHSVHCMFMPVHKVHDMFMFVNSAHGMFTSAHSVHGMHLSTVYMKCVCPQCTWHVHACPQCTWHVSVHSVHSMFTSVHSVQAGRFCSKNIALPRVTTLIKLNNVLTSLKYKLDWNRQTHAVVTRNITFCYLFFRFVAGHWNEHRHCSVQFNE